MQEIRSRRGTFLLGSEELLDGGARGQSETVRWRQIFSRACFQLVPKFRRGDIRGLLRHAIHHLEELSTEPFSLARVVSQNLSRLPSHRYLCLQWGP